MSTSESDSAAIKASLKTTRHRDSAEIANRLNDWLKLHGGGRVGKISAPTASGASSELFLIDLEDAAIAGGGRRGAVLRMIGENSVYPIVDPKQQFLCQRVIKGASKAVVPAAYGFEINPKPLGAAFILMERATGRGAPDWPSYVAQGWMQDLSPMEREILWRNAISAVADVHATTLGSEDSKRLALPTPGDRAIDRLIAYWRLYYGVVVESGDYPALDYAISWLEAERPHLDEEPRMVWGDASLRNMLFDGLKPSALLDLEFAHVGVPQFDIAFFAMMDRVMAEAYAGLPRLTGFPEEDETFSLYEQLSGIAVSHRSYFCRMAVTYMALANTRVFQRLAAEQRMAANDVGRNPPMRYLASMFGLPDPS